MGDEVRASTQFWHTIIRHWNELSRTAIVKHFWESNGIPDDVRGQVWLKSIGKFTKINNLEKIIFLYLIFHKRKHPRSVISHFCEKKLLKQKIYTL